MTARRTIVEVLRRSDQGATRPFVCLADDGQEYFVKGYDAGRRSLCCEWVAGNLARDFGLPVPRFVIADVPSKVIQASDRSDIRDLGAGLVFASAGLHNPQEFTWAEVTACPLDLQARILLFDWWVRNEDRSLTRSGGNPNLLLTLQGGHEQTWAFDSNLAFDETFSEQSFWQFHVFAQTLPAWPVGFRETVTPVLATCMERVDDLFAGLPIEWLYIDGDDANAPMLDQAQVRTILSRALDRPEEFWARP